LIYSTTGIAYYRLHLLYMYTHTAHTSKNMAACCFKVYQ